MLKEPCGGVPNEQGCQGAAPESAGLPSLVQTACSIAIEDVAMLLTSLLRTCSCKPAAPMYTLLLQPMLASFA